MQKCKTIFFLIIFLFLINIAIADNVQVNYGSSDELTILPIVGNEIGFFGNIPSEIPQQPPSGDTGSPSSVTIPFNLENPFGTEPVNGACKENEQIYDNKCYVCDPERGYLSFNPDDRSVLCTLCNEGFKLENNECVLLPPETKNGTKETIDLIVAVTSVLGTAAYYARTFLQSQK